MCIKTVYVYSSSTITVCANWGFGLWSTVTSGLTLELVNTLENIVWRTGCFIWNCCSDTLCSIIKHWNLKLMLYDYWNYICVDIWKKNTNKINRFFFSLLQRLQYLPSTYRILYKKKKHKTKTFFPPVVAVCVYIFVHIITNIIQNGCPPSIKKTFKSVTFWLIWFIFDN